MFKRDYFQLSEKEWEANEDLAINYLNFAKANKIAYATNAFYHYLPTKNGLASQKLDGYSYDNIKNTCLPLDALTESFKKADLADFYQKELECIYIKNVFQRMTKLFQSKENEDIKNTLANYILSYMETSYPTWQENPYYQNHFKTLEIPDTINCYTVKKYLSKRNNLKVDDSKENILLKYQKTLEERRK